jgi:uncharacterized lipoprotein
MSVRIVISLIMALLLVGCGHIYGEHGLIKKASNKQYTQYRSEPALVMPAHIANSNRQDYYTVPLITKTITESPVDITPPGKHEQNMTTAKKRSFFGRVKDWF